MLEFEQKKTFLGEESGVQELQEFRSCRSSGVQEFRSSSAAATKFQGSNLVQRFEVTNID
jgi:hypothetical protein